MEKLIQIKWINNQEDREECFSIRKKVFQEEQNVSKEIEIDEYDSKENQDTLNLLMIYDTFPIGTARLYYKDNKKWYLSRYCVLKEYRGRKFGNFMIEQFINKCYEKKIDELYLSSQLSAKDFYKRHGFDEFGEIYIIDNIPHIMMHKKLG